MIVVNSIAGNSIAEQYAFFPALNATRNGTSAVLLLTGRGLIARGRIAAHRGRFFHHRVTEAQRKQDQ